MKRNNDVLTSKQGSKYELDQCTWTAYTNFNQMLVHWNYELLKVATTSGLQD